MNMVVVEVPGDEGMAYSAHTKKHTHEEICPSRFSLCVCLHMGGRLEQGLLTLTLMWVKFICMCVCYGARIYASVCLRVCVCHCVGMPLLNLICCSPLFVAVESTG